LRTKQRFVETSVEGPERFAAFLDAGTPVIVHLLVNSSLDRTYLALAHPARRAIVERLVRGPATVGEATRALTISKPAVSKHLKLLEEAGIVHRVIVGRTHRLRLRPQALGSAADWLELHRQAWEAKFDVIEEHLK
jgi:DNA-binding transcriptional ArsR family regulator